MDGNDLRQKKFDYKWVIIGLCFLTVCITLGFCSSPKSLYIAAITEALSLSRGAFSINDSFRFITTSIISLFFGSLISRFGARKLICAGFVLLISSCIVYSLATSIYVFYIGGILLGAGFALTGTTMVGTIVNVWSKENRGTIMGAILASNGIGAAIALQILSPIIYNEANPFGYRDAYRLVALILLVVGIIVAIFFRNKPKNSEEGTTEVHKKKARGQSWVGIEYSAVIKKKFFYSALFCIFVTGMSLQGINGTAAPHMRDSGLDAAFIATVLSVHSLSLTVFKFAVGFVYDRRGLRTTSNMCAITAMVVFVVLANVANSTVGMILAMIYGIFSSLALPLETIMLPIYANDLFGDKSYAKILGIITAVNTAGYAVGAPMANFCYDATGSYKIAMYGCVVLMAVAFAVMQYTITSAHKERDKILSE